MSSHFKGSATTGEASVGKMLCLQVQGFEFDAENKKYSSVKHTSNSRTGELEAGRFPRLTGQSPCQQVSFGTARDHATEQCG